MKYLIKREEVHLSLSSHSTALKCIPLVLKKDIYINLCTFILKQQDLLIKKEKKTKLNGRETKEQKYGGTKLKLILNKF